MKLKTIICAFIAIFMGTSTQGQDKVFFDSKADLVGVSGDVDYLVAHGYSPLILENPINIDVDLKNFHKGNKEKKGFRAKDLETYLNEKKVGKLILDYLFQRGPNGKLSEELLKSRAWENVQRKDEERANAGVLDAEAVLKEDYLPILMNNYIFFRSNRGTFKSKGNWIVFHVDIDKQTLEDVFAAWDDPQKYEAIDVKVSFVRQGKYKGGNLGRKLGTKVPAFAIRGQVISRAPFIAEAGKKLGVRNRTRMVVYRQKMNKKGDMVSSKVCTTRACNVMEDSTYLYTIAGGNASYKKGDIAVKKADLYTGHSFYANMMTKSYGINYLFDKTMSFNRHGVSSHFLFGLGASVLKNHPKNLYWINNCVMKSPYIFDGRLGFGVGFTAMHSIQIMPYVAGQFEAVYLEKKYGNGAESEMASSINIPVGIKLNVNLMYPLQLTAGAEYVLNAYKNNKSAVSYEDVENSIYKPLGAKRDGINVYAGFRICF